MRDVLASVRDGTFAQGLADEEASGYPRLKEARTKARALDVERARNSLAKD
jgi:ketol-acid reductoisomerase